MLILKDDGGVKNDVIVLIFKVDDGVKKDVIRMVKDDGGW